MARIKYGAAIPDEVTVFLAFGGFVNDGTFIERLSKNTVTISVPDNDLSVVLTGKNFAQAQGTLSGTVTGLTLFDGQDKMLTIANAPATKIPASFDLENVVFIADRMLRGNDKVTGSVQSDVLHAAGGKDVVKALGGDDFLVAGFGNHTLAGGGGSDLFILTPSKGQTITVTDFDAEGGGVAQDYLWLGDDATWRITQRKDDVVLRIDGGGTVILRDVDRSDLDDLDFREPPDFIL